MIESLAHSSGETSKTRAEHIEAAAIELENLSRGPRGRYYLVCRLPSDEGARAEMEVGLRALLNTYKALVILTLTGDSKTSNVERRTYGDFVQMLPIKH